MAGTVGLITGGAQGLGKVFAEVLLKRGAKVGPGKFPKVCIADINESLGQETAEEFREKYGNDRVIFIKCDVTKEDQLEDLFEKTKDTFNGLDMVVNNAGIMDESRWKLMVDINLTSVIKGTMLGMKYMGKNNGGNGGHIINIASMAGLFPMPFGPVYTATKHGVVGLSRAYANEHNFAATGVRVNVICPQFANTNILKVTNKMVLNLDLARGMMKMMGMVSLEQCGEAFAKLLDDETLNGVSMQAVVQGNIPAAYIVPPRQENST